MKHKAKQAILGTYMKFIANCNTIKERIVITDGPDAGDGPSFDPWDDDQWYEGDNEFVPLDKPQKNHKIMTYE